MLLSEARVTALKNALNIANSRLATNLPDDQKKVFQSARDNALKELNAHNLALAQATQSTHLPPQQVNKPQPTQQQHNQAQQGQNPVRPAVQPPQRPEINVQINTPLNREPHTQMVVLEGNNNGDVSIRIPAVDGAMIIVETPGGEKKKLTLGQAFSRLRSLIRERLVSMKKLLYASKCFALAVSLYGGLCLATSKSLTAKEVFQKTVSKEIKAVFNQVVTAWNSKKA